ncbi:MAG: hypothetical protein H7Y59_05800 [Anaerolineales bacterium]|nr:hypothetical protein [Anaerolineales bacterium]
MSNFIIPILLLIDGVAFTLAAVFAQTIGLDPSIGWGRFRFILLALGIILILISLLLIFFKKNLPSFFESIIKLETSKTIFLLGHLWAVIFVIYAGFITFGTFTSWTHTTHYYTQLADAFNKGNLYIDRQPDKSLLEATDPYDVINRLPFDDEIWDMSFYKRKLYLYWGPVPALLIAPIQLILDKKITDNYLVFFFSAGLLIFNSLIILKLRKKFFSEIPVMYAFICIALIGSILPIIWATNIPNVYEAAIGAGHFFLIGGIYFSLSIFEQQLSFNKRNLFLAGLFWALSVGSRAINAISVIFLVLMVTFWIVKKLPKSIIWKEYFRTIVPLFIPLIAGALLIGWYNWARFDSPLEFGLRYQITIFNLNKDANLLFEPNYFFLNIYTYIFHPYEIISGFPFIQPTIASETLQKFNIARPGFYHAGMVTGLLFSAPFLALGFIHLFSKNKIVDKKTYSTSPEPYKFILLLLGGSFLINFFLILFYFYGQTRFLVDSISQITLLAIIGYWQIISTKLKVNSLQSKLFLMLANFLLILTICVSMLLAFSSETSRFETLNPQFFERINEFLDIQR